MISNIVNTIDQNVIREIRIVNSGATKDLREEEIKRQAHNETRSRFIKFVSQLMSQPNEETLHELYDTFYLTCLVEMLHEAWNYKDSQ